MSKKHKRWLNPKRTNLRARATVFGFEDGKLPDYAEPGLFELRTNYMLLACPGCGSVSGMPVGNPKPDNGNGSTWLLTGTPEAPTLHPSINCVGCCGFHGWLKNGVFTC